MWVQMTAHILTPDERRRIRIQAQAEKEIRDKAPVRIMKPWCIGCGGHTYAFTPPRTRFFDKIVHSFCNQRFEWLEYKVNGNTG